jgi:hypothetical protein
MQGLPRARERELGKDSCTRQETIFPVVNVFLALCPGMTNQ